MAQVSGGVLPDMDQDIEPVRMPAMDLRNHLFRPLRMTVGSSLTRESCIPAAPGPDPLDDVTGDIPSLQKGGRPTL